jgi:hypothetical protein
MRIISSFKDYYDGVGAYDRESEPLYVRKSQEIELPNTEIEKVFCRNLISPPKSYNLEAPSKHHYVDKTVGIIFFCGRLFPFYQIQYPYSLDISYCYNVEQYVTLMHKWNLSSKDTIIRAINSGQISLVFSGNKEYVSDSYLSYKSWARWIKVFNPNLNIESGAQLPHFPTAILLPDNRIVLNPRLNKYNFQSQIDPHTAYQEIDMYLSNLVQDSAAIPRPISDKELAETKGFNEKSFRKDKAEGKSR